MTTPTWDTIDLLSPEDFRDQLILDLIGQGYTVAEARAIYAETPNAMTPREKAVEALTSLWTEKFNESDWVRNRGRFADFVGRSGGSSGGAGGAVEEEFYQSFEGPTALSDGQAWVRSLESKSPDPAALDVMKGEYFGTANSTTMNMALRGQRLDYLGESSVALAMKDAQTVGDMAHRSAVALPQNVVAYRGISVAPGEGLDRLTVGAKFEDNGITSLSVSEGHARDFTMMWGGSDETPVILEVELPKGSRVVPNEVEAELALPPGSRMEVRSLRTMSPEEVLADMNIPEGGWRPPLAEKETIVARVRLIDQKPGPTVVPPQPPPPTFTVVRP